MTLLGWLGIGLSVLFALALLAEAYYLLFFKNNSKNKQHKRRIGAADDEDCECGDFAHEAALVGSFGGYSATSDFVAKLFPPDRYLFTIKEETKEDLDETPDSSGVHFSYAIGVIHPPAPETSAAPAILVRSLSASESTAQHDSGSSSPSRGAFSPGVVGHSGSGSPAGPALSASSRSSGAVSPDIVGHSGADSPARPSSKASSPSSGEVSPGMAAHHGSASPGVCGGHSISSSPRAYGDHSCSASPVACGFCPGLVSPEGSVFVTPAVSPSELSPPASPPRDDTARVWEKRNGRRTFLAMLEDKSCQSVLQPLPRESPSVTEYSEQRRRSGRGGGSSCACSPSPSSSPFVTAPSTPAASCCEECLR